MFHRNSPHLILR